MRATLTFAALVLLSACSAPHSVLRRADTERAMDALFQVYNRPGVPGANVLVVKNGQAVFAKSYGMANLEERIVADTNTNYRLASVTKPFTAMAILILAERKKLSLDDRLTDFFADFPAYGRSISVRHLLQHMSGLKDYEGLIPAGRTTQLKDRDVLELLQRQEGALFPAGEQFRYSNSGYALLALIVEKASGTSFAAFLKKNIFDPLGMTNTVAHEEGTSTVAERAFGYSQRTNGFQRTDQSLTSAVLGDGGIYSSVTDLAKWDSALDAGRLVNRAALEEAFQRGKLNNGRETDYGFGWQLNTYRGLKCISHSGSTIGFRNFIARFPEQKLTVIVLTNRSSAIPEKVLDGILDLFLPQPAAATARGRLVCQLIMGGELLDRHDRFLF